MNYYVDSTGKKEINYQRSTGSQWLDLKTLTVILVIFILGVIFFLVRTNVAGRGRRTTTTGEEMEEPENIFEINYQREIDKAISEKNYRFAIRLMFLRLLKDLSEKNIIQYKQDRTNFDYLAQVSATRYYPDFFRLTRNYEYTWYGKFDVGQDVFSIIKNDFEKFDHELK